MAADKRLQEVLDTTDHYIDRGWNLTDFLTAQLVAELKRIADALEAANNRPPATNAAPIHVHRYGHPVLSGTNWTRYRCLEPSPNGDPCLSTQSVPPGYKVLPDGTGVPQ